MRCLAALSFLAIVLFLSSSQGYRILCVFPYEGRSHFIVTGSLCKELAKRGHQVDMISHFPLKKPIANYTDVVDLSGTRGGRVNNMTMEAVKKFSQRPLSEIAAEFGTDLCKLMGRKRMQKFFKKPPDSPYDLVITEYIASPCYLALGPYYNTQVVIIAPFANFPFVNEFMGNPPNYGFISNMYNLNPVIETFFDRLWNFVITYYVIKRQQQYSSGDMEIVKEHLGQDVLDAREAERIVSLALTSDHWSIQGVRPTIQGVVEVGGLHIETDETKMTQDLQKWLDSAEHGVIYFTLGSMINVETMPEKTLLSLYASFAKISPIKVLMKSANATKLPRGLPSNVETSAWIPQLPVLKHKKTRAFITHGGLLGLQEAIYSAVPMIGIPLFFDQFKNVNVMASKNFGVVLQFNDITEQSMDAALNAVLYDPKYKQSITKASKLFRDRPMSAVDTAVYWVEYVIRNGPISLRSPGADIPWWKLYLVDVFVFLIACIALSIYLFFILLKSLLARLRRDTLQREKKLK